MKKVTAILLRYKRPGNIDEIWMALHRQTVIPEIMIIDNSTEMTGHANIPWNGGCFARLLFSVYAKTEWIMWISDDLCPGDNTFVEDALTIAWRHTGMLTGIYGHGYNEKPPHYVKMDNQSGFVPIIKGGIVLFKRDMLEHVPLARAMLFNDPEYIRRCDDLYLSLELGRGRNVHWADDSLAARTRELPDYNVGLCKDSQHYLIREQFCAEWAEEARPIWLPTS